MGKNFINAICWEEVDPSSLILARWKRNTKAGWSFNTVVHMRWLMFGIEMNRNWERTKLMTWQQHGNREDKSQVCDRLRPGFEDSGKVHSDSKKRLEKGLFPTCEIREKRNRASVISVHVDRCGYLISYILLCVCALKRKDSEVKWRGSGFAR